MYTSIIYVCRYGKLSFSHYEEENNHKLLSKGHQQNSKLTTSFSLNDNDQKKKKKLRKTKKKKRKEKIE